MSKVVIIGAGLAGSLLAIYLARRGFAVDVFEARPDMRRASVEAGRSINLALSDRGIAALREVGMDEYMLSEAVPMHGRMIHAVSGETKLLRYSGREGEYINSVSRSGLNIALMNEAEKYPGMNFIFNERCVDFHPASGEVTFASGRTIRGDTVIATDGAGSMVRQSMERALPNFESSSVFLEHGYKELHIPPGANGEFLLEKNALHIWPRHQFMMIALPNADGSFTCTLFLAHKAESTGGNPTGREGASWEMSNAERGMRNAGSNPKSKIQNPKSEAASFDQLTDAASLLAFFNREFPDAVPLMPTLVEDFFSNPTGELGTLKCWPWNVGGKALLLGDSAHAVVPFYGQGMNCAFEDVRVLDSLIFRYGNDWEKIYGEYGKLRKLNTDAIADMAEENFYEMRDRVADPVFQRKREIETKLEQIYPDYFSKYSMVTFREDLPYAAAKEKGNAQDRLLMEICSSVESVSQIDVETVISRVRNLT
jgi:kynurenine 3-monooxygenase